MRVGEALRRGILAGSIVVVAAGCSGVDIPHGEDGRAQGARGGSTPIGGAGGGAATSSAGGAGNAGGVGGVGGTTGMSGAAGSLVINPSWDCPACPIGNYGVTVHGDGGDDLELLFTGPLDGEPTCADQPLLGTLAGCSRTPFVHACEGPDGAGACLELRGGSATYTDHDGRVWTGTAVTVEDSNPIAGTASGTATLALEADGDTLELEVDYLFCSAGIVLRVVC